MYLLMLNKYFTLAHGINSKENRGLNTSCFMISYTVGILAITFFGTVIVNWRIVVSLLAVVSGVCFLGVVFIHDSPEWLMQKSMEDQAKAAWYFYNPVKSKQEYEEFVSSVRLSKCCEKTK